MKSVPLDILKRIMTLNFGLITSDEENDNQHKYLFMKK